MVSEPSEAAKKGKSPGISSDNHAQTTSSLEIGGVCDGVLLQSVNGKDHTLSPLPPQCGDGEGSSMRAQVSDKPGEEYSVLESPGGPEKRRCTCGSSGYREI